MNRLERSIITEVIGIRLEGIKRSTFTRLTTPITSFQLSDISWTTWNTMQGELQWISKASTRCQSWQPPNSPGVGSTAAPCQWIAIISYTQQCTMYYVKHLCLKGASNETMSAMNDEEL